MKTFLQFIAEDWQSFLPDSYNVLQPENLAKPVLDYQNSAWVHNGRIATSGGKKVFQYQPKVPDPRDSQRVVWADVDGIVVSDKYPEPEDTLPRQQRGADASPVPNSYPVK